MRELGKRKEEVGSMKFNKIVLFLITVAVTAVAFADASNVLIAFSTKGPDCYADGKTVVRDGEWYALVWSADGVFDGITVDCKAVDNNDEVVLMAPLAKNGCCPYTVFQVDSARAHSTGTYAVYMLDTRNADGTAVAKAGANGKPVTVNASVLTSSYVAASTINGGAKEIASSESANWSESAIDVGAADFTQAKIAAIKVEGAKVQLTVTGMMPAVKYNIRMGGAPDKLSSYALTTPKTDVKEAVFNIDAKDAKFFQVVREPIAK